MLSFQAFFTACAGFWTTERTYHFVLQGEIERSYTEFRVHPLTRVEKQQLLFPSDPNLSPLKGMQMDSTALAQEEHNLPGFTIAFDTRSEKGETVSMSLKALFVPEQYGSGTVDLPKLSLPSAAEIDPQGDVIQGFYLRDQGYSEAGAIAGRFTYQPIRQTLEMTTYYRRSVAVDQMRFLSPDVRMRTIVTYQRPVAETVSDVVLTPTALDLIGFGVERKQPGDSPHVWS